MGVFLMEQVFLFCNSWIIQRVNSMHCYVQHARESHNAIALILASTTVLIFSSFHTCSALYAITSKTYGLMTTVNRNHDKSHIYPKEKNVCMDISQHRRQYSKDIRNRFHFPFPGLVTLRVTIKFFLFHENDGIKPKYVVHSRMHSGL